jgi:hypothetical protein
VPITVYAHITDVVWPRTVIDTLLDSVPVMAPSPATMYDNEKLSLSPASSTTVQLSVKLQPVRFDVHVSPVACGVIEDTYV